VKQEMTPWAYVLAVQDLDRSAEFFRDVLGFRILWDDAGEWRLVQRDTVRVMLGHCPNDLRAADLGSHNWFGYVEVDDVDGFHAEIITRGAISTEPANRHYGMREVVVTTIDGHRIVFAQQLRN
jgi:catechol 2,3-dioxygenase-like lactoylglutathione lyase family enzyme